MPVPPFVPDGWIEWPDWSCDCRLYVPGPDVVLPPITWEPCPDPPLGTDCEIIAKDWMGDEATIQAPLLLGQGSDLDAQGNATLLLARIVGEEYVIMFVASSDGPVRAAVMKGHPRGFPAGSTGCSFYGNDINEGHYVMKTVGKVLADYPPSSDSGGIGGPYSGGIPALLGDYPESVDWRCGKNWLARFDSSFVLTAHPWDMSKEIFVASAGTDPDGYKATQLSVSGDAIFWSATSLYGGGIMVWDPVKGTRPFVRWPGDHTRMATNIGTDGVDLVWSEGEGKQPNEQQSAFPVRRIMTAPFTSDPDLLQPRRLRSQPGQVAQVRPWIVGCGHAVVDNQGQHLVVRLSDGWMWTAPAAESGFGVPVGIDCEHVYFYAASAYSSVARLRLDSLGPGVPPD
jgi:hypothetical protein